jgi:AraC family transcriptional regulator
MIGGRLASPPAVGELAQACGMSAGAFIRWFKAETGTTPSEVMTQRRVTEASRLLRYTDLSVEQVAAKLGYANRYHFSRVFARVAGCGPATFRRGAGA